MNIEIDCDVNIILLGESGVGKTSLLLRFIKDKYKDSLPETFIEKYEKVIEIEDNKIKLILWDTAGRKAFYSYVKSYYKVADAAVFVYDMQNSNTFCTLSKWLDDFKSVNENAEVVIAGNKADNENKSSVNMAEAKYFAQMKNIDCFEVSAKSCQNVNVIFHHIVQKILVAKGILPYSNDCLLTELERSKACISSTSVFLEPELTVESPCTVSTSTTNIGESLSTHIESTESHTNSTIHIMCRTETTVPCVESNEKYMANTINVRSQESCKKSIEQDLNTLKNTSNIGTNGSLMPNEIYEIDHDNEDASSGDNGFVIYTKEDLTTSDEDFHSVDSAESAEEFFETRGEYIT